MIMNPSTVMGINQLPEKQQREIYSRIIPPALMARFQISADSLSEPGNPLLSLRSTPTSPGVELIFKHAPDFPDPVLYGHLTDTLVGQIHILLYILNDPYSVRYDVDRMPDGRPTVFGTRFRHLEAEIAAMQAGLSPGQIRRGLRMLSQAIQSFEVFITSIGSTIYFAEPLYYHNAIIFERYGFNYQKGRKLMEYIQTGFAPGGDLYERLDGSSPFRQPNCADSIRLRSWAIHDGILGEPFTDVTMYKHVGKSANISTYSSNKW
jgi:hypothetical protein